MQWTTEKPTVEGWYFWRRNGKGGDSMHWEAYFYEEATDIFWRGKSIEFSPKGGEWAGPIPEPE